MFISPLSTPALCWPAQEDRAIRATTTSSHSALSLHVALKHIEYEQMEIVIEI